MKINYKMVTFFVIILILVFSYNSLALASSDDYIIDNYIVDDGKRIPIPETYILKDTIYNFTNLDGKTEYFKSPSDIFINEQGYIFVADTGNNRIVKINKDGEIIEVFEEANGKPFNTPRGIFVDRQGDLYIADTMNHRVVHLSNTGQFIEEFVEPKSELLKDTFTFEPIKLCVSPIGYIYILKGERILIMDDYNNFRGYMGQTDIGFRFLDVLLRIFASEEQKRVIVKRSAATYTNMTMDEKGMVYAVTMDYKTGEIKKLNTIGKNIYRQYTTLQEGTNLFTFDFLTKINIKSRNFMFGELILEGGDIVRPLFKDITVDKNGIVTVIEERTGKIYQYDPEGNHLATFGGKGDQQGHSSVPEAIDVDENGYIYVLDRVLENIYIFEPTDFIKKVHQAINLYTNGEYNEAHDAWENVLKIHQNYPLARQGLAKTLFKMKMWKESMEEYNRANDHEGYSEAFVKYRYEILRNKFPLILFIFIAVIVMFVLLLKLTGKLAEEGVEHFSGDNVEEFSITDQFKLALGIVFHPLETFRLINDKRDKTSIIPGVVILVTLLIVRVFYIFNVHFPLADINIRDSNIVLETVKLLLPVITWVISSYAITAIFEGESRLKDIFIASSYSMIPYILVNFPAAILSNVLSRKELIFYAAIINVTWIWIFILFFIQVKLMNNYKFGKTVCVSVLSILTMALIWAVGLMAYVLTGRLFQFVGGIITEIRMAFY